MLLSGCKALIFGVANSSSIAYGVAKAFKDQGATLAFSYAGEALRKRVEPISWELGGEFCFPCDVTHDAEVREAAEVVRRKWGTVDILVHSIAFANREDLRGRFMDTSRAGFSLALDVSAYSLVALCRAFEDMLAPGASVMTMTYHGSRVSFPSYNVMGVAKAALEACVRYLSVDLGSRGVRINAISSGPIKTLAASGISSFRSILSTIERRAPLRRNVTQEDVAGAAVFLASELSLGVTGDVLYVDAGYNTVGL